MSRLLFNIVRLILILIFFTGALELIGVKSNITILIVNFLTLILFFFSFYIKRNTLRLPAIKYFVSLLVIIFFSFNINNVKLILLFFFIKQFILPIIFFYALLNINFTSKQRSRIFQLLKILFIIQIPAALLKLYFIGVQENIIGTISYGSGSISTIFPLIAISYLLPLYFYNRRFVHVLYMLSFLVFSLIGAKNAIVYYLGILFIFAYILYFRTMIRQNKSVIFFMRDGKIFLIVLISLFFFVKLNPRMNPEEKVWGTVSLNYLDDEFIRYTSKNKLSKSDLEGEGRFSAYPLVFKKMLDKEFIYLLFGDGPGALIKSEVFGQTDALAEKYNLGYGGRLGLHFMLLQLGFIGLIVYFLFIFSLFRSAKIFSLSKFNNPFNITIQLLFLIFCLDFLSYSTTSILSLSISYTLYVLIYFAFSERYYVGIRKVKNH